MLHLLYAVMHLGGHYCCVLSLTVVVHYTYVGPKLCLVNLLTPAESSCTTASM